MSNSRKPFLGRLDAAGFFFDPAVLSRAMTRDRIRDHWVEGARLFEVEDCRALIFPAEVSVRAELAPGLPITRTGGALSVLRHGRAVELVLSELREADLSSLVELDAYAVVALESVPAEQLFVPDLIAPPAAIDKPDLRRVAGIGAATGKLARGLREIERASGHSSSLVATKQPRRSKGLLAKLALKTPAGRLLGQRHARYVGKLTERFERKDWDTALRSAVSLGGKDGALSLGLPKMRDRIIGPGAGPSSAGSTVPYGANVQAHLGDLYRQAAQQLEQEGKLMLAAFVHSDLLANPLAAVELLERHGETKSAAELAEGWSLDPSLVVRLWWLAGDKQRALRLGRSRGAFAAAIQRLAESDPEAERSLRQEWVLERREAQDHLGAVRAAWPDPTMRDEVMGDIAAGIAQGGVLSGTLIAHLLNHSTSPDVYAAATALMDEVDPAARASRSGFLAAFVALPAADPSHDRHLASRAVLDTLSASRTDSNRVLDDSRRAFRERADPLLAADLPSGRAALSSGLVEPFEIDMSGVGALPLLDAIAIGRDTILVALGEHGVRLLTREGKVRARWDIPTHCIVASDHGNRVVLMTHRSGVYSLHQLDLPMSKPQPLPPIRGAHVLDTYDGSRLITQDRDGLQWLERDGGRWRVAWRELTDGWVAVEQVQRVGDSMAALVEGERSDAIAMHWELPSVTLRHRRDLEQEWPLVVLATGHTARAHGTSDEPSILWRDAAGRALPIGPVPVASSFKVIAMGRGYALHEHLDEHTRIGLHPVVDGPELARLTADADARLVTRVHGAYVTIADPRGHIVVIDSERHEVVADFSTAV